MELKFNDYSSFNKVTLRFKVGKNLLKEITNFLGSDMFGIEWSFNTISQDYTNETLAVTYYIYHVDKTVEFKLRYGEYMT